MIHFAIPGLPKLQSGSFGHWRARRDHDKKWKELVWHAILETGARPPKPFERAELICTRYSASKSPPDSDNLASSFKPLIDACVESGLLVDDAPSAIGRPIYRWEKCGRGKGYVTISIIPELESPQSDPPR